MKRPNSQNWGVANLSLACACHGRRWCASLLVWCLGAGLYVLFMPCPGLAQVGAGTSAHALIEQGERLKARDEYAAARESYSRALASAERAGDTAAQAGAYLGLGESYTQQVKFSHALAALQRSLSLSQAGGDTAGLARANNALGYVYYRLYYYDSAERHLAQALAQFESIGDRSGMAAVLNNIGRNHISQSSAPEYKARALDYYRRSVELGEASGNQEATAGALNNLGNLYNMGSLADCRPTIHQAIGYYERALAIYEALGRRRRIGVVLGNLARAYLVLGDRRIAVEFAERAVAVLSRVEADDDLWEAYLDLGQAYWWEAYSNLGQAYQAKPGVPNEFVPVRRVFDEAIGIVERMRRNADGDELTLQRYLRGQTSPYLAQVDLLFSNGSTSAALAYAERAKARVLLDMLQRVRLADAAAASEQTQHLNDDLTALNSELARESRKPQPDAPRLAGLRDRLQQVRQALLDVHAQMADTLPESEGLRREVQPITLAEASALLPDEHSALLEYVVLDAWLYLFVLTRGVPEHALPGQGPAATTEPQVMLKGYVTEVTSVDDLRARIADFRRRLAARDNNYRAAARELYDLLLRPARTELQGKRSLVIVPDTWLWDLPFQALLDEDGRHLIETAAISYAPSLTALREMRKARPEAAASAPAAALLALGNPALAPDTITRAQHRYRDARLGPLPEAEQEVVAIGKLYGGLRSRVYTGARAREQLLKEVAGRFEILHLATHAIVNDEDPMYSALVLAQTGKQRDEDGLLEAWEIMQLRLHARLVVLSACETARGQVGAGEGMMGLSWAFLMAGVPAIVVSQWPVESASTTALMIEFHRQLLARGRARVSKAEALRRAALKLLQRDHTLHPFYWAAFVVIGDGA